MSTPGTCPKAPGWLTSPLLFSGDLKSNTGLHLLSNRVLSMGLCLLGFRSVSDRQYVLGTGLNLDSPFSAQSKTHEKLLLGEKQEAIALKTFLLKCEVNGAAWLI